MFLLLCAGTGWAWAQQQPAPTSPATAPYLSSESEKSGQIQSAAGTGVDLHETDHVPQRSSLAYEDWRKPQLPANMQTEISEIESDTGTGFTRLLLHAQWREMDPIDLWVLRPTGAKNPPPVILYLYSYPTTNDRYKDPKFCEFLTRNGFAAVGFVSAFTSQRFHDRPLSQWFVSELPEALGTSVHDVQMILNYLAARGDMDMTRIGMWGDGSGAAIAILAAAVDPRIKRLDLLDPWGDWPNWLAKSTLVPEKERERYLKPEFLKSLEDLDPVKILPGLKTQQLRIQHIASVTVTPALVRERLEAAAPSNAKIVHYPTAKAFFAEVASTGRSFDWIQQRLQPTTTAESMVAPSSRAPDVSK